MIKIAFSGQQGVGKSFFTEKFIKAFEKNKKVEVIKLADPIYKLSKLIYKEVGLPYTKNRALLQYLGTEIGRELFGQDVWTNILINKVNKSKAGVILCDDVRFRSELAQLKANGFIVVRIVPGKIIKQLRKNGIIKKTGFRFHKSEIDLKYCEWIDRLRLIVGLKPKYFDDVIKN